MSTRSVAETGTLRKLGFGFTTVLTLLLAAFIALSVTYRPRARLFPLIVAVPSFLCMLLILLSYFSERAERLVESFNAAFFETDAEILEEEETKLQESGIRRAIGWTIAALVGFYLFGFVLMTLLFVYAYMIVEGDHDWPRSAIVAVVTTGFMYALFVAVFGVRLDGGAVFRLLFDIVGI